MNQLAKIARNLWFNHVDGTLKPMAELVLTTVDREWEYGGNGSNSSLFATTYRVNTSVQGLTDLRDYCDDIIKELEQLEATMIPMNQRQAAVDAESQTTDVAVKD